jgi:hypothetical protein
MVLYCIYYYTYTYTYTYIIYYILYYYILLLYSSVLFLPFCSLLYFLLTFPILLSSLIPHLFLPLLIRSSFPNPSFTSSSSSILIYKREYTSGLYSTIHLIPVDNNIYLLILSQSNIQCSVLVKGCSCLLLCSCVR